MEPNMTTTIERNEKREVRKESNALIFKNKNMIDDK